MAKHIFVLIILSTFLVLNKSWSQSIPKKVLVEHFTNTRCGVCAFRNPGFYAALPKSDNVLHISYHPSSPYSTCLFNTQNRTENDSRTKYYDVYGGTPVFVINGEIRTGSDVQNVSVYDPFAGNMSEFKVETSLQSNHPDSITVISKIEAVDTHAFSDISIYLPLVEDTVFYNAPNGENIHRDVFRQSFSGSEPLLVKAPIKSGSPLIVKRTIPLKSIWDTSRLYAMSIIQSVSGNKPVLQTSKSPLFSKGSISSTDNESDKTLGLVVFPTLTAGLLNFSRELSDFSVVDRMGREIIKSKGVSMMQLDVSMLQQGMYFLLDSNQDRPIVSKFIKI